MQMLSFLWGGGARPPHKQWGWHVEHLFLSCAYHSIY